MGPSQIFFDPDRVGSNFCCLSQRSLVCVCVWVKKNLIGSGQKLPGSKPAWPLIYCGSKVRSGQGPSLLKTKDTKMVFFNFKVHPVFHFDISTESQISSSPHLQDPYEMLFVGVSTSTLPFAGEGLFAIDEIEPSTVVAFYNGIRIKEVLIIFLNLFLGYLL